MKYLAQTLDMPPPWSPKIYIEKDKFLKGTPLGEQTTFFIKMKVDKYSEYSQTDGLVLKYTLFDVKITINCRTLKKSRSERSATTIKIEVISLKENTATLMNLKLLNSMVLERCLTGRKSLKSTDE